MSVYDEETEERMRYGASPENCPVCHESISGMCKFHRDLERMQEFRAQQDEERKKAN